METAPARRGKPRVYPVIQRECRLGNSTMGLRSYGSVPGASNRVQIGDALKVEDGSNLVVHRTRHEGTGVDEAGIGLYDGGAGSYLVEDILAGEDAAGRDDHQRAVGGPVNTADDFG